MTSMPEQNLMYTVPLLLVSDIDKSTKFYQELLGFSLTNSWIPRGKIEWCLLEREGVRLMLQQPYGDGNHEGFPDAKVGVGVFLYFICKDALAIYQELLSKGVSVSEPMVGNECG